MVNGPVRAIAQTGNDVWIGGAFTEVLDENQNPFAAAGGLAALNGSGRLDTSVHLPKFTSSAGTPIIYGLSVGPNGELYVAGSFNAVDGAARKNVAEIDPSTGDLQPWHPNSGPAFSILATSSAVYVGSGKLLSIQLGGGSTPGWTPPVLKIDTTIRGHTTVPNVRRIVGVGNKLVIACQCDSITDANGTHQTKAVAEIDAGSGDILNWAPANLPASSAAFGIDEIVRDFPGTSNPTVFLAAGGNDFTAAYDIGSGHQYWLEDTSGSSQAIQWFQGDLIVGGHFDWTQTPTSSTCGDHDHPNTNCYLSPHLVAMDPSTGNIILQQGVPWNPGACCEYNGVWALLTDANGSTLHVGGEFKKFGTATWSYNASTHQYSMKGGVRRDFYARLDAPVPPQKLSASVNGSGTGSVTSLPAGIGCPGTCSASFPGNSSVTLTAKAAAGSTFSGWSGDCTGTGKCVVLMSSARSVVATFKQASACGRILFVSGRSGSGDIFSMDANGTGVTDLTKNPAADAGPSWSHDCHSIAFSSTRVGGRWHIFVMNANGTGVHQVTTGTGNDTQPTWAPGGGQLAFVSDRAGNRELYKVGTDGKGLTRLTTNTWADVQPDWSPEGNRIVFASNRFGTMDLYTIWSDGSHRTRLTEGARPSTQPEWSPSAARIVFISGASGTPQVWTMNAAGAGRVRITKDGRKDGHPTWAPLGARIAYSSTRSGNLEIWVIGANGAGAVNVTHNAASDTAPGWR